MKNVSLQINLSPFDYKLSKSLLPLQIDAFGKTLDEILLILDLNPEKVTNDVKKDADILRFPAQMPESYNQGQGMVMEHVTQLDKNIAADCFIVLEKEGEKFKDITL